jgi:hypothetical protein
VRGWALGQESASAWGSALALEWVSVSALRPVSPLGSVLLWAWVMVWPFSQVLSAMR